MKYGVFRDMLKSFLNRNEITTPQLDFFINSAKNEMQMVREFCFTRKRSDALTYPSVAGVGLGLPSDFRSLVGDGGVVMLGSGDLPTLPLRGSTFLDQMRRMRSKPSSLTAKPSQLPVPQESLEYVIEMEAGVPMLYLYPEVAEASLKVYYYSWIPDYGVDTELEDFLLKNASMVLLWGALKVSNRFVREENRIVVDERQYLQNLNSFMEFDGRIETAGSDFSLD